MKFLDTEYSQSPTGGSYRIDSERRIRIEEYQGKVGLADLRWTTTAMASDPCWSPDYNGLIDFGAAELEMSANDVLRLALTLRHEDHRSRGWMVYVVGNSAAFGTIRMLGYWSRNTERFRIFQTREEADAWLERHGSKSPPRFRESSSEVEMETLRDAV